MENSDRIYRIYRIRSNPVYPVNHVKRFDLDRYTPQLCCGWDKPSNNF